MKIVKYKKGRNGKYCITLDNNSEIILYEEVILKYNLLIKKQIDEKELLEIDKYNQECDVYYVALSSLKNRYKSIYEMKEYLKKKEYPDDLVDKAVYKLIEQGYLNDRSFAKSYISTQMLLSNKGPYKIRKELSDKKIDEMIIEDEIAVFSKTDELERIEKLIGKMLKTNKTRGGVVLKQKLANDLKNLGYSVELIMDSLNKKEIGVDKNIVQKEKDKLYRKLSRKYSGKELEMKLKEKLYQKGLNYED